MDPLILAIALGITVLTVFAHVVFLRQLFRRGRGAPVTTLAVDHTWDGAPARPDERAELTLVVLGDALLIDVDAPYHADPPPLGPAGPKDGLWEHEVVELFVLGPGERYTEVELGPHGHHLVLRLEGRRQAVARALPLDYRAHIDGPRWRGAARLPLALLPEGPLRVNAYAIHGHGDARRYLALTPVPGPEPDFHRLDAFVVPLEAVRQQR